MINLRKIYFRADASATIGYGHFIRSIALADMLKNDFDVIFFTSEPTEYQKQELEKICNYKLLKETNKLAFFLDSLMGNEIVVLDNYFYTTEYQQAIKRKGCKLVCIDEPHGIHNVCDLLISHGFCDPSDFDCEPFTKIKTGVEFALLRKSFLRPIDWNHKRNNDVVVNFGGADPFEDTEKIVGYLLELNLYYNIKVILGDTAHLSKVKREKVEVLHNLNAEQIAVLFDNAAFGIFTASTVCIEGLSRGLPMIIGYDTGNQVEGYELMKNQGIISPLGNLLTASANQLQKAIKGLNYIKKFEMHPENIASLYIKLFQQI